MRRVIGAIPNLHDEDIVHGGFIGPIKYRQCLCPPPSFAVPHIGEPTVAHSGPAPRANSSVAPSPPPRFKAIPSLMDRAIANG